MKHKHDEKNDAPEFVLSEEDIQRLCKRLEEYKKNHPERFPADVDGQTLIHAESEEELRDLAEALKKHQITPEQVSTQSLMQINRLHVMELREKNIICEQVRLMGPGSKVFTGGHGKADENGLVIAGECVYDYYGTAEEVTLPEGLIQVGEAAFQGHSELKRVTIPNGIKEIEDYAFNGTGLSEVSLPDSLVELGYYAFGNCKNLKTVILPSEIGSYYFGITKYDHAFDGCGQVTFTAAPGTVNIEAWAYCNCWWIKHFRVPYGVVEVEMDCFSHFCVQSLHPDEGLESISFPQTLMKIGHNAFAGNTQLKRITIPSGVTEIGDYAFAYCGLEEICFEGPPPKIGMAAFERDDAVIEPLKIFYPAGDEKWPEAVLKLQEEYDELVFEPRLPR